MSPPVSPVEVRLDRSRTQLSLTWADGATDTYSASQLRTQARDAGSVRKLLNDWAVPVAADIRIASIDMIGNYAMRIVFSDGHDRGIFPWAYLEEIAGSRCGARAASGR